jgi:hypothetical protein
MLSDLWRIAGEFTRAGYLADFFSETRVLFLENSLVIKSLLSRTAVSQVISYSIDIL